MIDALTVIGVTLGAALVDLVNWQHAVMDKSADDDGLIRRYFRATGKVPRYGLLAVVAAMLLAAIETQSIGFVVATGVLFIVYFVSAKWLFYKFLKDEEKAREL